MSWRAIFKSDLQLHLSYSFRVPWPKSSLFFSSAENKKNERNVMAFELQKVV